MNNIPKPNSFVDSDYFEVKRTTDRFDVRPAELYMQQIDHRKYNRQLPGGNDLAVVSSISDSPISQVSLPENLAEKLLDRKNYIVSFTPLQEWDGYVLEVGEESFRARILDITNKNQAHEEEVEIDLEELDKDSRSLLTEGRLFRWSIGYQRSRSGQKTRISQIVVRRLPAWTLEDIESAKHQAKEIADNLTWT